MHVIWTRSKFSPAFVRSPAVREGDDKLVKRLIQLFSSTAIVSKRRKICACWRKTRVDQQREESDPCLTWRCKTCGTNNLTSTFVSMRERHTFKRRKALGTILKRLQFLPVPRSIRFFSHVVEAERKWVWKVMILLYRCYGNQLATENPLLGDILFYSNYGSEIRNFIVQPYSNRIRKWYGAHHFMRAFQTTTYDARVSFRECLPITPGRTGQDRPLIKCFVASVNQSWIWCDHYTTSESKLCFCLFFFFFCN